MNDFVIPTDAVGVRELFEQYSRWGRWGDADEKGALNFLTDAERRNAAGLVRRGRTFSLSIPVDGDGPQTGVLGRTNPNHVMLQDGGDIASGAQVDLNMQYTDDAMYIVLQSGTQWDALAHIFFDDKMWNGYGTHHVDSRGAQLNSIDKVAPSLVGRGVLLDLPRHFGIDMLAPSTPISGDDLLACADAQGVQMLPGDIVLVRTGDLLRARRRGAWGDYCGGPCPGLSLSTVPVFDAWKSSAVATDTWTVEVWPAEVPEVAASMHVLLKVAMGLTLGEIFDLEALSEDCANDGVYEFLLSAVPLAVTGGVGSPVHPVAVK